MTTYSSVISKSELAGAGIRSYSFYKLNLVLSGLVILMMLAYIFLANFVVAQKYGLNLRKNELNVLNAQAGSSDNKYQINQDMESLLLFAKKSGMIEAKDIDSILQDRDFALNPSN